ncbi:Chromatin accessibility complex protein 1 [Holothuria leucospilota]|uniref:Chromatin accessibility complex protein 1 n=1 Tax=Holothuria leucospilota TaxID=206669 RepID=A0A9Q0YFH8_HOLLE|nr:Chromatin accessibility complex protein 1 [Holothuria leucospilota]
MTEKDQKPFSGGLPTARIRTIMKSSPEIDVISQASLHLITKATELFVHALAQEAHKKSGKDVTYSGLAQVVEEHDSFQFLSDILPQKVKVRDFYQSLQEEAEDENMAAS